MPKRQSNISRVASPPDGLGVGLLLAIIVLASAGPASAAESLVGTVTAAGTGQPLVSASVQLLGWTGSALIGPPRTTATDADGRYAFSGLADGQYQLRTFGVLGYIDEWYGNVACPRGSCPGRIGIPVTVAAGQAAPVVDFALEPGGTITGFVTDAGTRMPASVNINLYDLAGQIVNPGTSSNPALGGSYIFSGLVPGVY